MDKDSQVSSLRPDDTCWRVAQADELSLIVDAADYFETLRQVMVSAKRELLLIGWDFDFEIEMLPGQSDADGMAPDGRPNQLGPFIEDVVARAPDLDIYILKWNGALVVAPARILPTLKLYAFGNDRIHFALDGHHPFGACHHQKIVVADNTFAFCGGIDATEYRWDTSDHTPGDPRRVLKDGSAAPPWHDATMALSGPVAAELGNLSRRRWRRATDETLEPPEDVAPMEWPDTLQVTKRNVDVGIARTEPPYDGTPLVNEIERLCLDVIESAQDLIYIESQYFAARSVFKALKKRLRDPDGPEIIIVNPQNALSELEDKAMHVLRGRYIRRIRRIDRSNRFRIFYPSDASGQQIYVHAKILIADDRILRIGSSNLNDRSLGFDTECDLVFEETAAEDGVIGGFRDRLLAEHLGTSPETVARTRNETGSMIATIDALNPEDGRGLRDIEPISEGIIGRLLADTRLLDQRHTPGEPTRTGRGVRPRHVALIAGASLVGWLIWRSLAKGDKTPRK